MLSVTHKPFMLSVVMLDVNMLNVVAPISTRPFLSSDPLRFDQSEDQGSLAKGKAQYN
jgi:hypothetical protein